MSIEREHRERYLSEREREMRGEENDQRGEKSFKRSDESRRERERKLQQKNIAKKESSVVGTTSPNDRSVARSCVHLISNF